MIRIASWSVSGRREDEDGLITVPNIRSHFHDDVVSAELTSRLSRVEGLYEVNREDFSESKDKEISDQAVPNSRPNLESDADIDDGGPLSI